MRCLLDEVNVEAELPVIEVAPKCELTMVVLVYPLLQLLDLWLAVLQVPVDLLLYLFVYLRRRVAVLPASILEELLPHVRTLLHKSLVLLIILKAVFGQVLDPMS